jgi:hypothetical protein
LDLQRAQAAQDDDRWGLPSNTRVTMFSAHLTASGPIARPAYTWLAVLLQLITALGALPVGWMLITDPSGAPIGMPSEWIEGSIFGSYLVPGLYLLLVNGFGMLVAAGLTVARHWLAPWLTGALAVGLIVWIAVQLLIIRETMWLQWFFLGTGLMLGFIALFWLRRTRQLRLW